MQKNNSLKPFVKILSIFLAAILIPGVALPYLSAFAVQAESAKQPGGWVVTSIERSVIGEGYYLEPVKIPVYEEDTFETFMDRVMATAAKEKDGDDAGNGQDVYSYGIDSETIYTLKNICGADSGNPQISESIKTILSEKRENEILNMPVFDGINASCTKDNTVIGYSLSEGMYTAASGWRMTIDAGTVDPIKNIQFDDGSVLRIRFSLTEDGRDLDMTKDADEVIDEIYRLVADMKAQGMTADEKNKTAVENALKVLSKADLTKEEAKKIKDELESCLKEEEEEEEKPEILSLSSLLLNTENTGSTSLWPELMMDTSLLGTAESGEDSISQKISAVAGTRLAAFEINPPGIGTYNGDWTIMSLARSNMGNTTLYHQYYQAAVKNMKEKGGVLSKYSYTEYSRLILGLTAIGKDVTAVGGYNLLNYLSDYEKVVYQGLNGPIWALIALDSHDYEIPENVPGVTKENYNTRVRMIGHILDRQKSDGGWNYSTTSQKSDPDMTGMAMAALYRYTEPDAAKGVDAQLAQRVNQAMAEALNCLSSMQKETGDFASYGSTNVESTVWAYMGMCCMGIDPLKDTRFIKNGITVLDAIEKYYIEDEYYGCGFQHTMGGGWNDMATDQAHYGLVAYKRYEKDESFFFDMNDVEIKDSKVKSVSLDQNAGYFKTGIADSVELNVTVTPVDAAVQKIDWVSSDDEQAEVDQNGKVTVHLTKTSEVDPVVTITCQVTEANGTVWCDYYKIYSGLSAENIQKTIDERLPAPSKLKTEDMDALIFASKAYEDLSEDRKASIKKEFRDKLSRCQEAGGEINHRHLTALPGNQTTEEIKYYRLIQVESTDQEETLPWQVRVQVKAPDSSQKTRIKSIVGGKILLQAADISLTDLLTGEKYDPPEGTQIKVTMDVPNTSATYTESVEMTHFTEREDGGFDTENLNMTLSLDRQQVSFETDSFSCFAYVMKEKSTNGSGGTTGGGGTSGGSSTGKTGSTSTTGKSTGENNISEEDAKTMLELSGLTLGESDIELVDITGTGGLFTNLDNIENSVSKVFSQMKNWLLPFAVGCLVMGMIWIIQVCVSHRIESGKMKNANQDKQKK